MVALKSHEDASHRPPQRRKQERRGGIENQVLIRHHGAVDMRSRNAVVALKWRSPPRHSGNMSGSRNAVVALKPSAKSAPAAPTRAEAGTPWWH